jgi:proline iminopeptidase
MARSVQNTEITTFFFQGEIRTFNLLPQLKKIKCPTLVTVGDSDPITPMQCSEDIAAAIPSGLARLECFKGAGHGVQRDKPAEFDRVVREFIGS